MTTSRLAVLVALTAVTSFAALQQAHGRDLPPHVVDLSRRNATAAPGALKEETCIIKFEVKTGDQWRAGTDSVITFVLYDFSKQDNAAVLRFVVAKQGMFERGNLDVFYYDDRGCMRPCALRIESDGTYISPDWYCEYVRVTFSGDDSHQEQFNVHQWIGPNTGRRSVYIDNCGAGNGATAVAS